jgi:DNA mismatch repair protein MutL
MPAADCASTIQILPPDVVSRIAAGEVIERPAAVVKELIENSLDAHATHIVIEVKAGGLSLIRVADDGDGMRREDLPLAFGRHATSKLRTDRDLISVMTMGFRGEALPSIASISKIEVTTSTRREPVGARMVLTGGARQAFTEAAPVQGTRIDVSDLFFNQPVRKKFLKSPATEFSHISRAVQQAALAWPSVHFRLSHNDQEIANYPGVSSDRDRILQIYRPTFVDRTVDVRGRIAGCAVRGVAIDPVHARGSRTPQEIFVNRRPIRSAAVFHAVMEGYGSRLAKGRCPTFVLFLDIDPDRIDVNVHPAKREIRFAEAEPVHQLVRHALRHTFGGPERSLALERPNVHGIEQSQFDARETGVGPTGVEVPFGADRTPAVSQTSRSIEDTQLSAFAGEAVASYAERPAYNVVPFGQILDRYLVAQVGPELQVIDQHTAHERVLFERLWRQWRSRALASQTLLIPQPVELTGAQCALLQRHRGDLESLGLVIEPFGATAVAVTAVPVEAGRIDAASLLPDLLDDLLRDSRTPSLEDRLRPVLASLACHSAVRAGRALALPEIKQLIEDWIQEGLATTCPHGRRTVFRLATDELDKLFGRAGWS